MSLAMLCVSIPSLSTENNALEKAAIRIIDPGVADNTLGLSIIMETAKA